MTGHTTVWTPIGDIVLPIDTSGNAELAAVTVSGAITGTGFDSSVERVVSAQILSAKSAFMAPLPADLVSISSAAIATNRALTIAAQPPHARKLQIRQVIVTAITAGVLTLVGIDQDGNAVTETVSLIAAATQTLKSKWAYAHLTSATVTGLVGGGDGTLGLGVSNDFGVPTGQGVVSNFAVVKATKNTITITGAVTGWANVAADDVASTAVVDTAARTVAPTTAPDANGLISYELTVQYSLAA